MHKNSERNGSNGNQREIPSRTSRKILNETEGHSAARINVVMFSGGRGTAKLSSTFLNHSQINLNLLINAYDDGLSTGMLREFLPGLLGPSDIRKNITHLMRDDSESQQALKEIINTRLPLEISTNEAEELICSIIKLSFNNAPEKLRELFQSITFRQVETISYYMNSFYNYYLSKKHTQDLNFSDCSLGNLIFAGCYLYNNKNFNDSVADFSLLCKTRGGVYNITNGQNLVLVGLKKNGELLLNEAQIVSPQNNEQIYDIFLLENYLSSVQQKELEELSAENKFEYMKSLEVFPQISSEAERSLKEADVIIYGPGTQHSSLFPSYLTKDVGRLICENQAAEKIFISNIVKDHEIGGETAESLVKKLIYYLNIKNSLNLPHESLVSTFFFQIEEGDKNIPFDKEKFPYMAQRVVLTDWRSRQDPEPSSHSGGQVLEEIISLVNRKLQKKLHSYRHLVSIIVPALNEERSISKTVKDLKLLDIQSMGLGKEVIVVDGGSNDNTIQNIEHEEGITIYKLPPGSGRGQAYKKGINHCAGDIILFFPSDDEYSVSDIPKLLTNIVSNEYEAVFGSRSTKCINLDRRIKNIYQNNQLGFLTSKYGGMILSMLCLFLHNRYITDPLTSLKCFDAKMLKSLTLKSKGVDLDVELIARLSKKACYILEIPVDYTPRTKNDGKKITLLDGLQSILRLLITR